MEKATKKYKCRISDKAIFWTINSIDKIDKNTFIKTYLPTFKEVNFTPNFIDQFTVTIVLDKSTYTMLEITDLETNEIMYFLNANISQKLSSGFTCQFDLDVFLTYAWDYYKFLGNSNFMDTAFVNRAMNPLLWNWKNQYNVNIGDFPDVPRSLSMLIVGQKDPLVNYNNGVPVTYSEKLKPQYKQVTVMTNLKADGSATKQVTDLDIVSVTNVFYSQYSTRKKPLCYVYELANGTYMCLVRYSRGVYSQQAFPYNKLSSDSQKTLDSNFNRDNPYNYFVSSQDSNYIGLGAKINFLANKLVGCFEIPFYNAITDWFIWNGTYINNSGTSIRAFTDGVLTGFMIDRDGAMQLGTYDSYAYDTGNVPRYTPKINNQAIDSASFGQVYIKGAKSLISFMFRYAHIINFNYNVPKQSYYYNGNYLTFDGNAFNLVCASNTDTNFNAYVPGTVINQLRGTINISTDTYNEYVAQTRIIQNTGLQIAKQQMTNSTIDYWTNLAMSYLNAGQNMGEELADEKTPTIFKMLSPVGIAGTVLNAIQNMRNIKQKYQNYVKTMDAANQTARVTAVAKNFSSSVATDDSYVKMGLFLSANYDTGIMNRYGVNFTLDYNRLQSDCWFLLNYGFYINQTLPIQQVFEFFTKTEDNRYSLNEYIYMDFNFPTEKYIKLWKPNANIALVEVINTLNKNSMRIWKESPKTLDEMHHINVGFNTI